MATKNENLGAGPKIFWKTSTVETDTDYAVSVPKQFEQLTRELEVMVYTGLPSTETFQFLFDYLSEKARSMQYWRGGKQTRARAWKEA